MATINKEFLKRILSYDAATGVFHWKVDPKTGPKRKGDVAGSVNSFGYVKIKIGQKNYAAHRLAWLYVTGEWPRLNDIDHKNGVRTDNRFSNIRESTRSNNMQNQRKAMRISKTGFLGASPLRGKFVSCIGVNGKQIYLGIFKTAKEAHKVYVKAKRKMHVGCMI